MREEFLPHITYSQPAKPGLITVLIRNEKATRDIRSWLLIEQVFSVGAILLVSGIGLLGFLSVMVISRIQGTNFTMNMGWDVIYG